MPFKDDVKSKLIAEETDRAIAVIDKALAEMAYSSFGSIPPQEKVAEQSPYWF